MSVSRNLKEARLAANLSQEQVAEQLFVTRQTVSGWETGRTRPDVESLGKLAELYGVTLERLLYGSDSNDRRTDWRRKLVLASWVFAAVVVTAMLLWSIWRLVLSFYWPPEGYRELWVAWRDANDYFLVGLGAVMKLTMLILLALDAMVGDKPPLLRRWLLWGGTILAVAAETLLFAALDPLHGWPDYTFLPLVQYFFSPTLYLVVGTAIWLFRRRNPSAER